MVVFVTFLVLRVSSEARNIGGVSESLPRIEERLRRGLIPPIEVVRITNRLELGILVYV